LGTKGGLNKYDKKTGQFYLVNYKDTNSIIEDNFVYGLAADETSIYINTPPIVTILNYRTEEFETFITDFDYDGAVYDIKSPIIKDRDSLIWVGSYQGLSSFDVQEKRFSYFPFTTVESTTKLNSVLRLGEKYPDYDPAVSIAMFISKRRKGKKVVIVTGIKR